MTRLSLAFLALPFAFASGVFAADGNCIPRNEFSSSGCAQATAFLKNFQIVFRKDDRKAVAALIHYPLFTTLKGKNAHIGSPAGLLARYDQIFDPGVRCAVLNATPEDVWGNYQGFMIGNGDIWFDIFVPRGAKMEPDEPEFWSKYPFQVKTVNNGSGRTHCPTH